MAGNEPLPEADVLVFAWRHELPITGENGQTSWEDPVWDALLKQFTVSGRVESYKRGYNEVLHDLWSYKLRQEERDQYWLLHPQLSGRIGQFYVGHLDDRKICLFRSELRLNTDGPTMPVLSVLPQIIREVKPRLVLSVGLSGGVTPEDQVGDVVLNGGARFLLRGYLEGSPLNFQTFGGSWQAQQQWFNGIEFSQLQETPLVPPSPNYNTPAPLPQPVPHTPRVRLAKMPILTSPRLTSHMFTVGTPDRDDRRFYLGDVGSCVEMDAAPVAVVCGERINCGFVEGIATPAIRRFKGQDFEQSLRYAWANHFMQTFAQSVAANCAQVVDAVCRAFAQM